MRSAGDNAVDLEARFTLREGERAVQAAEAFVIIYENQLRSEIRAGENRGVNLQHERVVRFWTTALPLSKADGTALWQQTLKIPADWQLKQLGVAAFVQDAQAGEVLQAVRIAPRRHPQRHGGVVAATHQGARYPFAVQPRE